MIEERPTEPVDLTTYKALIEEQLLKDRHTPVNTSVDALDYRLKLDVIRRDEASTTTALIARGMLELEMIKLGIDPRNQETSAQFFSSRKMYETAEEDRLNRFGQAQSDIIIPQFIIDKETHLPTTGPMVTIWRENSLDSYVRPPSQSA